ncbi:MAG: hypothetical protein K9L70_12290 [Thiohalocapsa sp.]|nr:hypothetical protein [Thiohalocapsa sp.]MCF7990294.1 hypothetical protein [Thiohalocapsa sp.]
MPEQTDVAPACWLDLADAGQFYPEDLPPDWRLTYFANEFHAAFAPAAAWSTLSQQTLADWRADVHAGFRFYLQLPLDADADAGPRAVEALGATLAAFVAPVDTAEAAEPVPGATAQLLVPASATPAARAAGSAIFCPPSLNADLRGARAWLEQQIAQAGAAPGLVLLTLPTARQLTDWHSLLALMGLGRL